MTNMMRKIGKVILVLIAIQIIFAIQNASEAAWWDTIISSGDSFLNKGKESASKGEIATGDTEENQQIVINTPSDSDVREIINDIYNILFPLGVGITVIIGGALGIKFMVASAEDKAKVKEAIVPYVAGCVVIYGAFGIWKLCMMIFSALS